MRTRSVVLFCAVAGMAQYAMADTVILKNGTVYEGQFTRATSREVTFNSTSGGMRRISIEDIERIRFGTATAPVGSSTSSPAGSVFAPPSATRTRVGDGPDGRAIEDKYAQLGGQTGFLGQPTSEETPAPDGRGRFRHYKDASVYWSPESGAHEIHGAIRAKYAGLGWEKGVLGYPMSDETPASNGGRYSEFQKGRIYYHPSAGTYAVYGGILDKWKETGAGAGYLGYPRTDEKAAPDQAGHFQHFQNGSIYWNPKYGAHIVHGPILVEWEKQGWEQGPLGYPTSDEQAAPNDLVSRVQHFERGDMYVTPGKGVRVERR